MKKYIRMVSALVIMIIGAYMLFGNMWPTPPALSGLALLLTGFLHWMPYCPICKAILKD